MKRFHVHVGVRDLQQSVRFYSALPQKGAACCYAKSAKYWTLDPQGVAWESFHTLEAAPVYGEDRVQHGAEENSACCAP